MESDLLFRIFKNHDIMRLIQTLNFKVIISIFLSLKIGSEIWFKVQAIHYVILQKNSKQIYLRVIKYFRSFMFEFYYQKLFKKISTKILWCSKKNNNILELTPIYFMFKFFFLLLQTKIMEKFSKNRYVITISIARIEKLLNFVQKRL